MPGAVSMGAVPPDELPPIGGVVSSRGGGMVLPGVDEAPGAAAGGVVSAGGVEGTVAAGGVAGTGVTCSAGASGVLSPSSEHAASRPSDTATAAMA